MLELIDLDFLGTPRAIGAYLVETAEGLALFDCGPATTATRLHAALAERSLELSDVHHLFLSHIHFDHAGAAGAIVREHPGLTVWVSEIGARHLVDPSRLEASARRLYGEAFDRLWGGLVPVPEQNIRLADGDVLGWEAFPTPGHASHHVSYFRDGTLLAGDACGVRIPPATYVLPPTPPPDIDLEAWHVSLDEIERRAPERLALIHFGIATDVPDHLERFRAELDRWSERVRSGMTVVEFVAAARAQTGGDAATLYDPIDTFGQSWQGLRRYWDKRSG